jgi:hypothetical protein
MLDVVAVLIVVGGLVVLRTYGDLQARRRFDDLADASLTVQS